MGSNWEALDYSSEDGGKTFYVASEGIFIDLVEKPLEIPISATENERAIFERTGMHW